MSAYGHGRHEHGQNFLTDHKFINSIIDLVKQTSGPIIESTGDKVREIGVITAQRRKKLLRSCHIEMHSSFPS